jgi:hypothetical protein
MKVLALRTVVETRNAESKDRTDHGGSKRIAETTGEYDR